MKRTFKSALPRRRFLQAAGAAGVAAPFLSSMADADIGDTTAKRLIIFLTPNEPVAREYWLPPGAGDNFALTSFAPLMASLEPYRDKILMMGDLEMSSRLDDPHTGGHIGMGHLLVGRRVTELSPQESDHWASGISLDQYIGQACNIAPLTLGVRCGGKNGNSRISYLGDSQPVDPIDRADDAFDSLLADAILPPDELAALKAKRLSVLDRVTGDITRAKTNLPTEAREKLDIHADMIRDLEQKIESDQLLDCNPTNVPEMDYNDNANFPTAIRRQIDVMIQSLGCGISDIATLQVSNSGGGNITPLWSDEGININIDYHTMAHDQNTSPGGDVTARRLEIETWWFTMFAYLLEQLDAIPEGTGGTMLDNSLVVWTKPIGWKHNFTQMLFMFAGSANGQLQTGRFKSFPSAPHNNLLVNILNLMGIDEDTYGDPQYCTGPLDLS